MEYALRTNNLIKCYKSFAALDGLNINVPCGSVYGFVGKNGAGKTTLIRVICGLQKQTSGSFSVYGTESVSGEISRARRRMGAVIESPSFYPSMTAEDNLKQQYCILGRPSYKGISELLYLVGLENTKSKKAGNFSLGMRQRLGIAIALAGSPDFLILDEPTNGLDPQGIIDIRELILRLNREKQITVLISSHILEELSKLATHYGFIDSGRTISELSAKELEARCRKCTHLTVSDAGKLSCVLDKMKLSYDICSAHDADVYGEIHISELARALDGAGCTLLSVNEHDESLESFYMELMGGKKHE